MITCFVITAIFLAFIFIVILKILNDVVREKIKWESAAIFCTKWLGNSINGRKISDFILANHYKHIAVLGYNAYVYMIKRELEISGLKLVCGISSDYCQGMSPVPGLPFYDIDSLEQNVDNIDLIIDVDRTSQKVGFTEDRKKMESKKEYRVIDIDDIVFFTEEEVGEFETTYKTV